ncbi:MAG: biotin transporter BioY [Phaeodactylibacter sp.]|nr:biotin transporter BioY [Phaeodactylibacter sp.]MCB9275374.1 biotin transporter BioY [Lewinellaceae bacterium]
MPVLPFFLSLAFMALMAQAAIQLPAAAGGIPITGQSLAVLMVGMLLRRPWPPLAVAVYVLLGALGLPVFAGGRSGWSVLAGGSGGFLFGFIAGAWVVSWLAGQGWGRRLGRAVAAMAAGTVVILAFGLLRLAMLYGWEKALEYGLYPFWKGAIVKIFIGGLAIWLITLWPSSEEKTVRP